MATSASAEKRDRTERSTTTAASRAEEAGSVTWRERSPDTHRSVGSIAAGAIRLAAYCRLRLSMRAWAVMRSMSMMLDD